MRVHKVIKTSTGTYTFDGELSQEEVDVIMTVGIGYLLERGALPIKSLEEEGSLILSKQQLEQ